MYGVAIAEDNPASINPVAANKRAPDPNVDSNASANTIGLFTTVPVPNNVAEVVIIRPNVITTPKDTFIFVSKYESDKSLSSVHFSALATEWNTKLIAIMVVPIKAIVVTVAPSGMDGIKPLNTSPMSGPTITAVTTKMIPIIATKNFMINSIIFGVE